MIDAPLALEGEGQDGQDHHLHTVCHPAQPHDEAEHDLELAEPDVVHGLGDSERIVGHDPARRRRQLDLRSDHVEVGGGAPAERVVRVLHETLLPPDPSHPGELWDYLFVQTSVRR